MELDIGKIATMESKINNILKMEEGEEKCIEFFRLVSELEEQHYKNINEIYYKFAKCLWNNGFIEDCIKVFSKCYSDNFKRQEIKKFIFDSFINHNKEEVKKSFKANIDKYNNVDYSNINYEDLKLEIIPVSNSKYYVFDLEKDNFDYCLDLEEDIKKCEKKYFNENTTSILIIDDNNFNSINYYLENNLKVYYYTKDILKTLSFFKISNILEKRYNKNLVIFKNTNQIEEYFKKNVNEYLPSEIKDISNSESDISTTIQNVLKNVHENRIKSNYEKNNILLSICIPTFNRGKIALENVEKLLKCRYDSEIEIVVSNNGSERQKEDYDKIKYHNDSRISYYEFESNQGFIKNMCNVLQKAKGKFALLISDEDTINISQLPTYLKLMDNNRDLGLILSGSYTTYTTWTEKRIEKGDDAFFETFLKCNYMSGMIYNTDVLKKYNFVEEVLENINNRFCELYSHEWLNDLVVFKSDCYFMPNTLCIEGKADESRDKVHNSSMGIIKYATYEDRIKQHNDIIEHLNQLPFESKMTLANCYVDLCWKTNFLPSLVKESYIKAGADWNEIYDHLYECCIEGIYKLNMEITPWARNYFEENIKKYNNEFR